ncbi:MAG: hypothetical protein RL885_10195 [Planctomycetota bacterium]
MEIRPADRDRRRGLASAEGDVAHHHKNNCRAHMDPNRRRESWRHGRSVTDWSPQRLRASLQPKKSMLSPMVHG